MNTMLLDDRIEVERRLRAMMAGQELPSWVTGFDVEFGTYPDGNEPAVWINLRMLHDLDVDKSVTCQYGQTVVRLRQDMSLAAPGYLALVDLTTVPAEAG